MECFKKKVEGFEPLTIFATRPILETCQGSEYGSAADAYFSARKKLM